MMPTPMKSILNPMANELKELSKKLILGDGTTLISFVGDLPEIDLGDKHALLVVDESEPEGSRPRVMWVGPDDSLEAKAYPFLVVSGHRYQILAPRDLESERGVRLEALLGFLRSSGINISTVRAFGTLFSENIIRNVPEICRAESVKNLQGKCQGLPAILIASGPSLSLAISTLQALSSSPRRTGVRLIAADSLISYLPSQGIEPDFHVTVDPQKATYDKINGATSLSTLFFHPAVFHLIPKEWRGPLLTTSTQMAPYQILQLPDHGHIEEDVQCQMHLAFNLAAWMGCDPIVLVGQDLCYHGERLYAEGAQYMKDEDVGRILAGTFDAKNVKGEIVQTTTVFESYRTTFERKFRAFPRKVFNATEGGINIAGAENVCLRDLLERFALRGSEVPGSGFGVQGSEPATGNRQPATPKLRLAFLNDCLMVAMGILPDDQKLLNMVRVVRETLERIGPD